MDSLMPPGIMKGQLKATLRVKEIEVFLINSLEFPHHIGDEASDARGWA
jgi:hypothetical protein